MNKEFSDHDFEKSQTKAALVLFESMAKFDGFELSEFDEILTGQLEKFERLMDVSYDMFGTQSAWKSDKHLTNLKAIHNLMDSLVFWSSSEEISMKARTLRNIYTIAKFETANAIFTKIVESRKLHMDLEFFIDRMDVKFECDVFMNYPNASVDAFFTTIFKYDGQLNDSNLASLIDAPFNCPVSGLSNLDYTLDGFLNTYDALKGKNIEQLFKDNYKVSAVQKIHNTNVDKIDISFVEYDYKSELLKLENSEDSNEKLLYALILHVFDRQGNEKEISNLLESLKDDLQGSYYVSDFEPSSYDGSDNVMIQFLRHYSQNGLGGATFFEIPCAIIIENPNLLSALDGYYGSQRDNFLPRSDCRINDYPLPASIDNFLNVIDIPSQNWLDNHQGTMRFYHYRKQSNEALVRHVFPRLLKEKSENEILPFETWSFVNLENRKVFDLIQESYQTAKHDLTKHYQKYFSMSFVEAQKASISALATSLEIGHWGKPPRDGLRYKILENYSFNDIQKEINNVSDLNELVPSQLKMEYYAGAWAMIGDPDPLIMMAVKSPDILMLLLQKQNSYQHQKNTNWDVINRSNPQTDVNAKNDIGKNALHAAVQLNQLESAKILVDAGIDVDAIVSDRDLMHNNRTVAMYAAANGDLNMLKYLKDQGIDFTIKDSKGFGVFSYLMGVGVLEMNPHLTLENLNDYVSILQADKVNYGNNILPRFDCEKASNYSEKLACDSSFIAALDRMLLLEYKQKIIFATDPKTLKQKQIIWVKLKNACKDELCVKNAYQSRLKELN
ncbi:ankyrin repeat domain-containing protein [Marinicellulosiphila megalodicopiae]|uniref:ankyrin repeat domain-containing protein n=1 Tax=Marinicellulosiphila megalodicopiae TaxID=2724896 RepID=UPI003BAE3E09